MTDLEIGGFCLAMRIKGETPDEMAGFLDATHQRLSAPARCRCTCGGAAQLQRCTQAARAHPPAGPAAGTRRHGGAGARDRHRRQAHHQRGGVCCAGPFGLDHRHRPVGRPMRLRPHRGAAPRPQAPAGRAPRGRPAQPGAQPGQAHEPLRRPRTDRGQLHAPGIRGVHGRHLRPGRRARPAAARHRRRARGRCAAHAADGRFPRRRAHPAAARAGRFSRRTARPAQRHCCRSHRRVHPRRPRRPSAGARPDRPAGGTHPARAVAPCRDKPAHRQAT